MIVMMIGLLLAALYVYWRTVAPLRLHWAAKAVAVGVFALAALKFVLIKQIGGHYFAPEVPTWVLLSGAWLFTAFLLYFIFILMADTVRLLVLLVCKICRKTLSGNRFRHRINGVLAVLACLLAVLGVSEGQKLPRIREVTVSVKDLSQEAEGMRIAVLADLHVHKLLKGKFVSDVVRLVQGENPDLVLIVGDFVDGRPELRGKDLLPLKGLSAPEGVYGVSGNHEYYYGGRAWKCFIENELNIPMLSNEHRLLKNGTLALAGITDYAARIEGTEEPNLKKALRGIPAGTPVMLMAHRPTMALDASKCGVALQVSGHTHGGMIWGFDRFVALFNFGFVSGEYRVGDLLLSVSNGTGIWNGFPVRLGIPSEIVLIRLQKA